MKKNNKSANVAIILLVIIIIIGALLYFLLPKDIFSKSKSSGTFGSFKNDKRYVNDGVPSPLKWKRSFAYDEKEEKNSGSFMRYMIDKNKDK